MKLKPIYLGISIGTVWGFSIFITTIISHYTGYGRLFLEVLAKSIYPGYEISLTGSILGLIYGFLDGLISGSIIGFIYNRLSGSK